MPMEEYLIYKTMARFKLSYEQAQKIIQDLQNKDELEGYVIMIDEFNILQDLKDYYRI
nr:MAG TPA: hypothetical protein [Caudoviricetes sp.]